MGDELIIENMSAEDIVQDADDHHIWINAMHCIRPTDDIKKEIGEMVIRNLNRSKIRTDLGSTVVFLKITKS